MLCFFFYFYWSIAALQCCVSSTAQQSESALCIHISPLFLSFEKSGSLPEFILLKREREERVFLRGNTADPIFVNC